LLVSHGFGIIRYLPFLQGIKSRVFTVFSCQRIVRWRDNRKMECRMKGWALTSGDGFHATGHKPKCVRIFLIISWSSIKAITLIEPQHLKQLSG